MRRSTLLKLGILAVPLIGLAIYAVLRISEPSIERLIDPDTRVRTYHTMWSQKESSHKYDFYRPMLQYENFKERQISMHLWEIPQKDAPETPLYLLLRDQSSGVSGVPVPPWSTWKRAMDIRKWTDWFSRPSHKVTVTPMGKPGPEPVVDRYIISMHASDGTLLDEQEPRPFRGNNMTTQDDVFFDINQDGWVERVTTLNMGFSGTDLLTKVVEVTRINEKTDIIFRVVIEIDDRSGTTTGNQDKEWNFQVKDTNGDGMLEILIGEKRETGRSITPAVTFFWNEKTESYETRSAPVGAHYRVLTPGGGWQELQKLYESGMLDYPLDKARGIRTGE